MRAGRRCDGARLFLIEMNDDSLGCAGIVTSFFAVSLVIGLTDVRHGSQACALGTGAMSSSLERVCAKQTQSAHLRELQAGDTDRETERGERKVQ
jgi:hypothetical protein